MSARLESKTTWIQQLDLTRAQTGSVAVDRVLKGKTPPLALTAKAKDVKNRAPCVDASVGCQVTRFCATQRIQVHEVVQSCTELINCNSFSYALQSLGNLVEDTAKLCRTTTSRLTCLSWCDKMSCCHVGCRQVL